MDIRECATVGLGTRRHRGWTRLRPARERTEAGFTLVEVTVAVTVVLLMAGAALLTAPGILAQARQGSCDAVAESISNAVTASYGSHGDYSGANDLVDDEFLVAQPVPAQFTIGTASAEGVTVTFGTDCSDDFVPAIWSAAAVAGEYEFGAGSPVPPDPPGSPLNLLGVASDQQVALTWEVPSDDGGAAVTGYHVSWSSTADGTFVDVTGCTNVGVPSCVATSLTNGSTYYFKVAAINSAGTGDHSSAAGPYVPLSCAEGGPCEVGDTGPGGGTVFYIADSVKSWGRYLEVAPADWAEPASNDEYLGVTYGCTSYLVEDAAWWEIGRGEFNTTWLLASAVACGGVPEAADKAAAYDGGGLGDWFLPSEEELIQLCRWSSGQLTGPGTPMTCSGGAGSVGLTGFYWSSTDSGISSGHYQAFTLNFTTGARVQVDKSSTANKVRPIRAF